MSDPELKSNSPMRLIPQLIFASRWLQLPLYLGLIVAQGVYVVHFLVELLHLVEAAFGNQTALQMLVNSIGYQTDAPITSLTPATRSACSTPLSPSRPGEIFVVMGLVRLGQIHPGTPAQPLIEPTAGRIWSTAPTSAA
jgi:hypothetical protein